MKSILYKIFRLKIIKISAIIGILIIAVINIHNIYTDYLYRNEPRGLDSILPMVINSVIGIPYYNDSEMQNSATDIIKFSQEDWFRFKCSTSALNNGGIFKAHPPTRDSEGGRIDVPDVTGQT